MPTQTTVQYPLIQNIEGGTSKIVFPFSVEEFKLFLPEVEPLELGKIFHFEIFQPKKKLWGLFKGLKVEEKDIEEAKKSLFPEKEF